MHAEPFRPGAFLSVDRRRENDSKYSLAEANLNANGIDSVAPTRMTWDIAPDLRLKSRPLQPRFKKFFRS